MTIPDPRVTALATLTLIETCSGRVSETARLPQSAVDFRARLITFAEHKTDATSGPKLAVLTDYQAAIFRACLDAFAGSRWMFPSVTGDGPVHELWRSMCRACRHVGLRPWGPHAARRGIAHEALEAGASLEDIQAMLGHESRATTERYLGWSPVRAGSALRLVTLGGAA